MHAIRNWLDRSVIAQCLVGFALAAGVIRLISPELPVLEWLIKTAFYGAVGMAVILVRRRQDRAAMGGISAGEQVTVERKLIRGQVPQERPERETMARLVAHRRRQMGRFGWTFVPLLALMVLLPSVAWALLGAWTGAVLWLLIGAAFGGWLLWMRRLNLRRLHHMEQALSQERAPAAPARG